MNNLATFVLQALTPSWKFFEDVGHIPRLSVKVRGEWIEWIPRYKRGVREFFINPQGNFELAKITLLERFVNEVTTAVDPQTLIASQSYRLVESLSRDIAKATAGLDSSSAPDSVLSFQFRIDLLDQRDFQSREELFVSTACEV